MRFTQSVVEWAAGWASTTTDKAFAFGYAGGNVGYGARYVDGVRQLVWLGRYGAREATAYYLGGGAAWTAADGKEVPEEYAATLARLQAGDQPLSVREAAESGASDGRLRWQVKNG